MSRLVTVTIVVMLLRLASHAYAANRLGELMAESRWKKPATKMVLALALVLPLLEFIVSRTYEPWSMFFTLLVQLEGFIFLVGWLLHGLGRFVVLVRQHGGASGAAEDEEMDIVTEQGVEVTRRDVTSALGVGVAYGVPTLLFGYGSAVGRVDYTTEELVVRIPGLPKELDGYTIAQVSDVHTGPLVGEHQLRQGFELVRRIKPDLIVATGDVVDHEYKYTDLFARVFTELPARDGHVAIMGNHDHYAGAAEVTQRLRRGGVRVLDNEHLIIQKDAGKGIALVGLDDPMGSKFGGGPDVQKALRGLNPDLPRIMLQHRPDLFDSLSQHAALMLAGHTHGGQVSFGPLNPARIVFKYVRGKYTRGESTLWVNRGFGVVGVPARIDSAPEITKIVLVAV